MKTPVHQLATKNIEKYQTGKGMKEKGWSGLGNKRILPTLVVNLVFGLLLLILRLADFKDLGFIQHRAVKAENAFLNVVGDDLLRSSGWHGVWY